MDPVFEKLNPVPAVERPDLMAESTFQALELIPQAQVFAIDPELSETESVCQTFDLPHDIMGNAVLVMGRREGEVRQCCCMSLANRRVDVNGFVRKQLNVRKASFAPMELAVESSGMEYGAITPVGLSSDWPVWIDESLRDVPWLIVGSGVRHGKLIVPGASLLNLPGVQLMEGLTSPVSVD
jgi:prolyl-tRNA editing enzyme YbaK/EbsC (Cys-tRNA(Pro) deacylase)